MCTSPFHRLIWKETRTLGPVWIALLAAVVMLQFIFVVTAWLDPASWRWDERGAMWGTLAMVCMPLGFCLAAAVAGILFAGESEEGTDEWLRVLPIPPRTLAVTKIGAGLGALGAFMAAGLATASLWTWINGHFLRWTARPTRADVTAVIGMILLAGVAAFVTGVFLSVRMRRVIAVVAGTLVGTLPLFGIADWFANDVLRIRNDLGAPLLFTAVGLLDVWLVLRWCRGEKSFAVGLARRAAQCVVVESPDKHVEPARRRMVSLRVLQRGATLGVPSARSLAVLLWKEARSAAPFAIAWTAAGLVFLTPTLLDPDGRTRIRGFPVELLWLLAAMYWSVTPGLFGVLAAGERRGLQTFLGDRGVSPTQSWIARQAVGLTLACALTIGWTWAQHTLAGPDGRQLLRVLLEEVRVPRVWSSNRPRWVVTSADLALRQEFAVMSVLGLYAVGQLCGFWFRNVIVALGVTVFLSVPFGAWLVVAVAADVPFVLAAGPLVILWLAGTWRLMAAWLTAESSRRVLWRRTAWTLLPCLVALAMFVHHRRTQIPVAIKPFASRIELSTHRAALRAESQRLADLSAPEPARDLPPAPDWPVLKEQLEAFVPASGRPEDASQASGWSEVDLRRLDADFAAFAERVRNAGFAAPSLTPLPPRIGWAISVVHYATHRGAALREAGDRPRELQLYLDALAILREVRELPPVDDQIALRMRVEVFRLLAQWAQSDEVTAEELRRLRRSGAFRRETEFASWLPPETAVDDFAKLVDRFYEHGPSEEVMLDARPTFSPRVWRVVLTVDRWLGERERIERFLNVCRANAEAIAVWDWRPEPPPSSLPAVSRAEIERWAATTGPLRWVNALRQDRFAEGVLERLEGLALQEMTELACERGVRLLIALEEHRRQRGGYPRSLAELVPKFLVEVPVDPFTGGEFVYLPEGLDAPWVLDARRAYVPAEWGRRASATANSDDPLRRLRVVPPRQPLVFSRGPYAGGYVYQAHPPGRAPVSVDVRPAGLYREVVSGAIDGGGPSGREPPALGEIAETPEARVTFIVLGREFIPW